MTTNDITSSRPIHVPHRDMERVAAFLSTLKAARSGQRPDIARKRRLIEVFDAVSAFRRTHSAPPPKRPPRTVEQYDDFLQSLNGAVARDRDSGGRMNVWAEAGLKRNEVRTAAVLKWLLDRRGTHGFGGAVLRALLSHLKTRGDSVPVLEANEKYWISLEHCALSDRSNRIDIAIELATAIIFIELKIDAQEGREQIERYLRVANQRSLALRKRPYVLFLTRGASHANASVVNLTWTDVSKAIREAVDAKQARDAMPGQVLLQFARHIEKLK